MVMDVPGLRKRNTTSDDNDDNEWYNGGRPFHRVSLSRRPYVVPSSRYRNMKHNVYSADNLFVMNCYKQWRKKYNPAHLLLGFGKLFVYATGYYNHHSSSPTTTTPTPLDMLLYNQCATTDEWPWGKMVERLFWDYAVQKGVIRETSTTAATTYNTSRRHTFDNNEAKIVLPGVQWRGNPDLIQKPDDEEDAIVCGKTVYQEPFSQETYLGGNPRQVVEEWQRYFAQLPQNNGNFKQQQLNGNATTPSSVTKDTVSTDGAAASKQQKPSSSCARKLRVAAWNRTEGSALRLLTNMDDIRTLVAEYTDNPLKIVTSRSDTPPEQVAIFRDSFDILLTSHGSHLANMMFSPRNTVYIELAAVYYDNAPFENGQAFAKEWINSFGHLPARREDLVGNIDPLQ